MIANELPECVAANGPFHERFMVLHFRERVNDLQEERVVATLWGCIQRRMERMNLEKGSNPQVKMKFNDDVLRIKYKKGSEDRTNHRAETWISGEQMLVQEGAGRLIIKNK